MTQAVMPTNRQVLIDTTGPVQMHLVEGQEQGGRLIVEGKVGHCDRPTANGRLYTRPVMEREITRLQERINGRSLLAAVDHPGDGKSRIRESGAICTSLRVERDGSVIGKYEIVEESTCGRDLAAFLRRGAAIGMSSRGIGSCRPSNEGHQVVGEDFKLYGYDFVSDPACNDAYPKLVAEGVDPQSISPEAVRSQFPQQVSVLEEAARKLASEIMSEAQAQEFQEHEQALRLEVASEVRKELTEDFSVKLVRALQRYKEQIQDVVRSEYLADPTVAGAKKALEDIGNLLRPYAKNAETVVVDDRRVHVQFEEVNLLKTQVSTLTEQYTNQIASLRSQVSRVEGARDKAIEKARGYGHALFVERAIAGRQDADAVRAMIGDPNIDESVDALQERVAAAITSADELIKEAESHANEALAVERHKTQVAKRRATEVTEQAEMTKEKVSKKVEELTGRFQQVLTERDQDLEEAKTRISLLEKTLEQAESRSARSQVESYADRRTLGHPRRTDIMAAMTTGKLNSIEEVNALAEQWDIRGEEPGGANERVRRSLGRGREAPTEGQRTMMENTTTGVGAVGGVSMDEMRRLAGVGGTKSRRTL